MKIEVGSLNVGDRFWFHGAEFEVTQNSGSRYIAALSLKVNATLHLDQQEEVEVKANAD